MKMLLLSTLLFLFAKNAFSQQTAKEYFDFIEQEEIAVGSEIVKLSNQLKSENRQQLMQQLQQLKTTIETSTEKIEDGKIYPKSKYLKQAAIEYFASVKYIAKHELTELVEILTQPNVEATDKFLVSDYFGKIEQRISKADEALKEAKEKFCKANNIDASINSFKFYLNETK